MILDGKKLAASIYDQLSLSIKQIPDTITLGAILVGGEDSPSMRYIRQKRRECKKIGMEFSLFQFEKNITQNELIHELEKLNNDTSITGYIVQLPLPEHIDESEVIKHIHPRKDVDGFHPENQGKVMLADQSGFTPCTPAGVMRLMHEYDIRLSGQHVVIIGKSNIVGKPLIQLCISQGATVTSCNSKTPDLSLFTRMADIVIVATGKAHLLTHDMLGEHTSVIDVGFSVIDGKVCGDADYDSIISHGHNITPVPGGVGPMTVAMLLSNTLKAYEKQSLS